MGMVRHEVRRHYNSMGMFDTVMVTGLVCGRCGHVHEREEDVQFKVWVDRPDGSEYEPDLRVVRVGEQIPGMPKDYTGDEDACWGTCDGCGKYNEAVVHIEGGAVTGVSARPVEPEPTEEEKEASARWLAEHPEAVREYTEKFSEVFLRYNPFFEKLTKRPQAGPTYAGQFEFTVAAAGPGAWTPIRVPENAEAVWVDDLMTEIKRQNEEGE